MKVETINFFFENVIRVDLIVGGSEITRTKVNTPVLRVTQPIYYVEEIKGIVLVFN